MSGRFHLFALIRSDAVLPDTMPAGLEHGDITLLSAGPLTAVAQSVSDAFMARLREGNDDPATQTWLTERLLEHERVVERFVAAGVVFPLGFGVLLMDPKELWAAIAPHSETLLAFFEGAAGRQEWCLKFYLCQDAPRRGEMAKAAQSGLDYLAARRALPREMAAREARGSDFVKDALTRLEPHCAAVVAGKSGAASGKGLRLLANLALLVRASECAALLAGVDALLPSAIAEGLEMTLTGPWPLYSFRPRLLLGAAPLGG